MRFSQFIEEDSSTFPRETGYLQPTSFTSSRPSLWDDCPVLKTVIGALVLVLLIGVGFWLEQASTTSQFSEDTSPSFGKGVGR